MNAPGLAGLLDGIDDPAAARPLAELLTEAVYVKDIESRLMYANAVALRVLDKPDVGAIRGLRLSEIFPGAEAVAIERNDRQVLATGRAAVVEETYTSAGETRRFLTTKSALRDPAGQVHGLVCISIDITALAVREGRTRSRALQLRRGLQAAGEQVCAWNPVSGRFGAGCRLHEWIGQSQRIPDITHWREHIHPQDRAAHQRWCGELGELSQGMLDLEYRVRHADGRWLWIWERAMVLRGARSGARRVTSNFANISERKGLEERQQTALDAAQIGLWSCDAAGGDLIASARAHAVIDQDAEAGLSVPAVYARIVAADRRRVLRAWLGTLHGRQDPGGILQFRIRTRQQRVRWLECTVRAVLVQDPDARERVAAVVGTVTDITLRRQAEAELHASSERLRQSEQQLRALHDNTPVGIARASRDRRYRFVNRAYAQDVLALPAEEAPGRAIAELLGPAAEAARDAHIVRVLAGERVELSTTLEFKGVGTRAVNMSLIPERDERGEVSGWIEVINDLTERDRVASRLHQRDREFKTLVENAPDVIARLDQQLRYLYINRAIHDALGMDPEAFVGRSGAELGLPQGMLMASEAAARAAFDSGAEQPAAFEVHSRGELRHFSARLIPEFDRGGEHVESVVMVIYDITDRARAQRERDRLLTAERAARERAEGATRARDQFLAIVSHELRSPLNGIQNWTNVLEGRLADDANNVTQRALTGIKGAVDQQVRLIEDLLDATRIMSGTLSLATGPVEIRGVIEAAVASVRPAAQARNIELQMQLELGGERVRGDPDRLQQIIWNLLSNGIKFTPAGGHVRVVLDREGSMVRLCVSDNGKGIAADFLPGLFEWFRRDETSSQRGQDGLGLGLAMARHLCELHGGTVTAFSLGPGLGATFEVRLPLLMEVAPLTIVPAESGARARQPLPSLAGLRVMAIDDQADALEALSALLSGMQAQVWTFGCGADAVQWIRNHGGARCADVVLCDIAMPGEDGYSVLARIRALEQELGGAGGGPLPVLALTAFAQREERQRALDAGFAMHLAKPVDARELALAIADYGLRIAE